MPDPPIEPRLQVTGLAVGTLTVVSLNSHRPSVDRTLENVVPAGTNGSAPLGTRTSRVCSVVNSVVRYPRVSQWNGTTSIANRVSRFYYGAAPVGTAPRDWDVNSTGR
jgi:hypothetical protein